MSAADSAAAVRRSKQLDAAEQYVQKNAKNTVPAKQPYVGKKFVKVAKLDSATNLQRSDSPDQVVYSDDTELQPIDK